MSTQTAFFTSDHFTASFSLHPATPLEVDLQLKYPLASLSKTDFLSTSQDVRRLSLASGSILHVPRWGMTTNGDDLICLKPLHGVDPTKWGPVNPAGPLRDVKLYRTKFPGWVTSMGGPMWTTQEMEAMVEPLRRANGYVRKEENKVPDDQPSEEDDRDPTSSSPPRILRRIPHDPTNLFARLIKDQIPTTKFHDTQSCTAFLTPFPFVPGALCVIPRKHWTSDILALPVKAFVKLMEDTWDVLQVVKTGYGVKRCAIFFEGYEIDWAHVKVFPIWEEEGGCSLLRDKRLSARRAGVPAVEEGGRWAGDEVGFDFQEAYDGYLTSRAGERVSGDTEIELSRKAEWLRGRIDVEGQAGSVQ